MANAGARNIIAISRSGCANPRATELTKEMRLAGINLQIQGIDVTDAIQVQKILELTENKPVSGIIQGAMVLKVGPFGRLLLVTLKLAPGRLHKRYVVRTVARRSESKSPGYTKFI